MPDLAAVEQAGWHEAERRGAMLRTLAAGRCRRSDAAAAAAALGLSTRQVYALVRRLRASGGLLTALVPRKPNGGRGRTRLAAAVEAIIGAVIGEVWLDRQQRSIADAALEVRRRCLVAGLKAPAPSTIYRRITALDPEATVRRRRGYDAARVFAPVGPSSLVASRPLAVVQMDHTPVDLVIVDERHRRPIGRPYLTVAIDVYSRCVVGFCLTLDPPSSVSVGLCLTHAVLPKEAWLAERGVEASWPVFGLPAVLHVDNAPEFHSEALQRGCLQHGIELDHRPVARPHFGGIVERLIGSLMQLVHRLPGTTFSNPTERGSYPSEDRACLTLGELERWVTLAITGLHHRRLHSGIGTSPIVRWREELARPPALPADPKRFLIDFLPVVRRRLRRQGVVVDAISYDSPALRLLARPGADDRLLIRRDPRDLSRIHVFDAALDAYQEVPYRTLSRPPITLWEHREASRALRAAGRAQVDEAAIFATVERMRAVAAEAACRSKAARRRQERLPRMAGAEALRLAPSADGSVERPVEPYEVEEW